LLRRAGWVGFEAKNRKAAIKERQWDIDGKNYARIKSIDMPQMVKR